MTNKQRLLCPQTLRTSSTPMPMERYKNLLITLWFHTAIAPWNQGVITSFFGKFDWDFLVCFCWIFALYLWFIYYLFFFNWLVTVPDPLFVWCFFDYLLRFIYYKYLFLYTLKIELVDNKQIIKIDLVDHKKYCWSAAISSEQ